MRLDLRSNGDGANFRLWLESEVQPPENEVRLYPSKRHSLAGNPCLPEITWLREVVFYHGAICRLADTMVKVSQYCTSVVVV